MSTNKAHDDLSVSMHRDQHPDAAFLDRIEAAIIYWREQSVLAPTSSIIGSGAFAAVESVISAMHDNRLALFLPSATYGLRVALLAVGVRSGDDVLIPGIDWPATYSAVAGIGARPVPVPVDPATMTIDPSAAGKAVTGLTRAVVACHLHGVCADVPALRNAVPGLPIVEDCAQAFGSMLDGQPAGTLGDVAVLSFGPGKTVDAGEGGVLLARDQSTYDSATRHASHPMRVTLATGAEPSATSFTVRPHPMAAILALYALAAHDLDAARRANQATAIALARRTGVTMLGVDIRRANAQQSVPAFVDAVDCGSTSGARVLPGTVHSDSDQNRDLLSRIRLVTVGDSATQSSVDDPC